MIPRDFPKEVMPFTTSALLLKIPSWNISENAYHIQVLLGFIYLSICYLFIYLFIDLSIYFQFYLKCNQMSNNVIEIIIRRFMFQNI